jgi:hypothetical protein
MTDGSHPGIAALTAGTNPVTGVDQYVIEFADREQQVHEDPWSEARELAHRLSQGRASRHAPSASWSGDHPPSPGARGGCAAR